MFHSVSSKKAQVYILCETSEKPVLFADFFETLVERIIFILSMFSGNPPKAEARSSVQKPSKWQEPMFRWFFILKEACENMGFC